MQLNDKRTDGRMDGNSEFIIHPSIHRHTDRQNDGWIALYI